jgi:hypothetical protein
LRGEKIKGDLEGESWKGSCRRGKRQEERGKKEREGVEGERGNGERERGKGGGKRRRGKLFTENGADIYIVFFSELKKFISV